MRLTESQSRSGDLYRRWHFIDGLRVSERQFHRIYTEHNLTPEMGVMSRSRNGFRKDWIV